ncbi:hypothetical protein [Oxynema sp. CENA135]|nr:hypothetical protein [Oxynema sp. CENA135]
MFQILALLIDAHSGSGSGDRRSWRSDYIRDRPDFQRPIVGQNT